MESSAFKGSTHIHLGSGAVRRLGRLSVELGLRRLLVVSDPGLLEAGHVSRVSRILEDAGLRVSGFHDFDADPTSGMAERGRIVADRERIDGLIGLGGGSSLDCAKAINFLLTNGGEMKDYWGYGKASKALLPMLAVPTTAGTGSEVQTYALITDDATRRKMACGDPKAAFRHAILDPDLTVSMPRGVTAASGFDALGHAVETYVTVKSTEFSRFFSIESWRLLVRNFPRVLDKADDLEARGAMLLGACLAGVAIENSMLGAAHALANPLSERFGTAHGVAIALLLPHVVRWNTPQVAHLYQDLTACAGLEGETLADVLESLLRQSGLPRRLRDLEVPEEDLPALARGALQQWTGTFNPRKLNEDDALALYQGAF